MDDFSAGGRKFKRRGLFPEQMSAQHAEHGDSVGRQKMIVHAQIRPNLKVYLDVLPGKKHEGVFPTAFIRGIVGVFADDSLRKPFASPVH